VSTKEKRHVDIAWHITPEDLEAIEIGANVLGTGGGGNPYTTKLYARELLRQGKRLAVVDPLALPDDALVVAVGGMGAPTVSIERIIRGDEFYYALRAIERRTGRKADAVISKEIGGSNAMRPLLAAALADVPVVDADGMGRAFPELQMCTFFIYGLSVSPAALCDVRHNIVILDEVLDPFWLERLGRAVTIQMGCHAAYAMAPWTGAEIKRTAVMHTLTQARQIGERMLQARQRQENPIPALVAAQQGRVLFEGKIVDVLRRVTGGFARGKAEIEGLEAWSGRCLTVEFQNENLIAREEDTVVCSVPDLICILDRETATPINTELLRYGYRVTVLGFPAPAPLVTAQALRVVGPQAFGYDLVYRPLLAAG
jgi:DUF917 family protein